MLSGSNGKHLALLILALFLVPVGTNLVSLCCSRFSISRSIPFMQAAYCYDQAGVNFLPFGCLGTNDTTDAINIRLGFLDLPYRLVLTFCRCRFGSDPLHKYMLIQESRSHAHLQNTTCYRQHPAHIYHVVQAEPV